jgi:hypothetical protein
MIPVPANLIEVMWPLVEHHLDLMIAESFGDLDKGNLKARLLGGSEMLIVISDGAYIVAACIVTVSVLDTGRKVLYVPGIGGERMSEWLPAGLDLLRKIASDFGCDGIRACGRAGWAKVIPSANALHTIVEFN